MQNKLVNYTAGLLLVILIGQLLIVGRGIVIPMVIALLIWHLLNALLFGIRAIPKVGKYLPDWIVGLLATVIVVALFSILGNIIENNVSDVIQASARYQASLLALFNKMDAHFHFKGWFNVESVLDNISFQTLALNIYAMFSSLMSSAVLILLYVAFLFVEQHFFTQKLQSLFPQKTHLDLVNQILSKIIKDTERYLSLKTFVGLLTAVPSYFIMQAVGLDFAAFWALLIFLLNYIPNIGSIIATIFPAFLALLQFEAWWPFTVITVGILVVQFIVGSIIEPKLMGRSLNVSPLVILIALALWGSIWGILGMFLAVPITVIMMIVFAHFETTQPIAVLLSQDGNIER